MLQRTLASRRRHLPPCRISSPLSSPAPDDADSLVQDHRYLLTSQRSLGYSYGVSKGSAGPDKTDVLQGTLDLMVLKTLESLGPQHGYGIARHHPKQVSEAIADAQQGAGLRLVDAPPAPGLDLIALGHVGQQSQGQVLHPDRSRSPAAHQGDRGLGTHGRHHSPTPPRLTVPPCGPPSWPSRRVSALFSDAVVWMMTRSSSATRTSRC